jgi:hypothetical protein
LPLVSGGEARRYETPRTGTFVLFPYQSGNDGMGLIPAAEMSTRFPKAWSYLRRFERTLRDRENRKMDLDDRWWAYNYPKNLDKQHLPKLGVAQTVPALRVCVDTAGRFCFNNVRVNAILSADEDDLWYLLAVMNGRVANFVFRRIAKPKDGGWFEANKQFIAPLPVPRVTSEERAAVVSLAKLLLADHDRLRELTDRIGQLLSGGHLEDDPDYGDDWLIPSIGSRASIERAAPSDLLPRQRMAWVKAEQKRRRVGALQAVSSRLYPGVLLSVDRDVHGDIRVLADGAVLFGPLPIRPDDGDLLLAQWGHLLESTTVTESFDGERLARALLPVRRPRQAFVSQQIVDAQREASQVRARIAERDDEVNAVLYGLYGLSMDEITRIERESR